MTFNSVEFLIFFPIVFFIYFLVPHRIRWLILLISSYCFYMAWRPEYVLLILLSTYHRLFCLLTHGATSRQEASPKTSPSQPHRQSWTPVHVQIL